MAGKGRISQGSGDVLELSLAINSGDSAEVLAL
jgi:hypothetical protein